MSVLSTKKFIQTDDGDHHLILEIFELVACYIDFSIFIPSMMTEPTTSISTAAIQNVVLQCASCKSILGDTTEFVCAATLPDTKLITVRGGFIHSINKFSPFSTIPPS